MNIGKAIKKSLIQFYIDPFDSITETMEEVNQLLDLKEREKKYYKKTIRLDIRPGYSTNGLEKKLKKNIIELTEYNDCWVKELGPNVFYILV